MSAAELYDMVMLSSTYELLDRMPEVPRKPILITSPLPAAPLKPIVPKVRVTKPKADPAAKAAAKAHKTAATAAVKEALRAAKAAEKAAAKEATRLRRALAAAVAKHASKPAKKV